MIFFLNPLVDDGAGPDIIHVGTEDGVLVGEKTRLGNNAASLGHEDGDGVIRGLVKDSSVAASLERAVTAPPVGVEAVEFEHGAGITTREVLFKILTDGLHVGCHG